MARARVGYSGVRGDDAGVRLSFDVVDSIARPQAGAVSVSQLLGRGADRAWIRRQVDSHRWQRVYDGVVVTHGGPVPWRTRAWAALLHAGPGAVLSHKSAAYLHDFGTQPPRTIDVSIPHGRRVVAVPGVVVRRRALMPPSGGRPARTWRGDTVVDLAAGARSEDDAIAWICAGVRAGARLLEITDALARRTRVPNRRVLDELLAEAAAGVESALERRYHRDVGRSHGLPPAELQVREVVCDLWIRADCVYRGLGVRVELDGALAHPQGRTDADTWRDNAVVLTHGEVTLRYRWRHVAVTPCATAVQVAAALTVGGWRGRARPCGPDCPVGRPTDSGPALRGRDWVAR